MLPPSMHKKLFVYNSDFQIVDQNPDVKEEKQDIPTQVNTPKKEQIIQEDKYIINKETIINTAKKTVPAKTAEQKNTSVNTVKPKVIEQKTVSKNKNIQKQEITKQVPQVTVKETIKQPSKVVKNENQTIQKPVLEQNNELAPEEELILWNKWRSDLQNKIMQDVKLPIIQEGIVFKFSFDVDKYGKITNIKTWSTTTEYTPYAIQYIAPVIRSYQGKDILNFPAGSKRFSTTAQGAWKISKSVKYSTPQDYSDTEKITGNK